MKPHELKPAEGAVKRPKRVGRGDASGKGKTAGRGTKGTRARGKVPTFFEGGQMPLARRVPKLKGFTPPNRKVYGGVNLTELEKLDGSDIGPDELRNAGLVHKRDKLIKILGQGDLTRSLNVTAHAFSATARQKIEAAGGSVTVIKADNRRKPGAAK
jgi:large subunit ribosomal protein L15